MMTCVAISGFRSDPQVIALLDQLYGGDYRFDIVVVVCSLDAPAIAAHLAVRRYGNCFLHVAAENLGSAGNLHRRFVEALAHGADYMLALNHDAKVSPPMFRELLAFAAAHPDAGAVYPLRYKPGKHAYDLTGVDRYPFRMRAEKTRPSQASVPVFWGSSNGALYALAPMRRQLHPRAGLWMGWEDYLYGLDLDAAGYSQYIACNAETDDEYEYKDRLSGRVVLSDKPAWTYYYTIRNFFQITCYLHPSVANIVRFPAWAIRFPLHALATKGWRAWPSSLAFLATGLLHGILNVQGKWRLP